MLVMMIEGGLSIVRTTRPYITLILQLPLTESDRGRVFTTQKFTDYFTHLSGITNVFIGNATYCYFCYCVSFFVISFVMYFS